MVLPTSNPRRVGLLAGVCWTKSQSPHYSPGRGGGGGGGGPWLQMTTVVHKFTVKLTYQKWVLIELIKLKK